MTDRILYGIKGYYINSRRLHVYRLKIDVHKTEQKPIRILNSTRDRCICLSLTHEAQLSCLCPFATPSPLYFQPTPALLYQIPSATASARLSRALIPSISFSLWRGFFLSSLVLTICHFARHSPFPFMKFHLQAARYYQFSSDKAKYIVSVSSFVFCSNISQSCLLTLCQRADEKSGKKRISLIYGSLDFVWWVTRVSMSDQILKGICAGYRQTEFFNRNVCARFVLVLLVFGCSVMESDVTVSKKLPTLFVWNMLFISIQNSIACTVDYRKGKPYCCFLT